MPRRISEDRSTPNNNLLRSAYIVWAALSFVVIYGFHIHQVGVDASGGAFSVGSHPAILGWDAVAIALFIALMLRNAQTVVVGAATRRRRIAAFFIDFWFVLLTLSGPDALVPLWLEATRTGHFVWHFQRNHAVNGDVTYSFVSALIFAALTFLYFAFPLTRGSQTVGCFVMRIKVTPPFGDGGRFTFGAALRRTWSELIGMRELARRKWDPERRGQTSYDIRTKTTVVLVEDC